jgi:Rrf2 family transcriptional regulator, iron-sulfur cluster assembly transcription factor
MMLTSKGRYAVMAMVDISLAAPSAPVSLAEIAGRQDITIPYLEQIFLKLRATGLVKSVRGPGGGYFLSKQPSEITIAEVISAVDESIKMTRCSKEEHKNGCTAERTKCLTHDLWDGLGKQIENYLDSVTLADVCNKEVKKAC